MSWFMIVETDRGLTVTNVPPNSSAEETAVRSGGVVVDAGPYPAYDEAYDAMQALDESEDDD